MTAAEQILKKRLVDSGLSSAEWEVVQSGLKERAMFSSRVESLRFLGEIRDKLADLLSSARNSDGALTSRAQLVSDFMRAAREAGISDGSGGLTDPGSSRRAQVIIDTNAGLARGYANFAAGASQGARLAYPAQELVRLEPRRNPRGDWPQRWQAAGGRLFGGRMVALKTDPACSRVSRFGVPYGPPDFGSGMGWIDVSFEDAVSLGLIQPDYMPSAAPLQDFNDGLEADLAVSGESDPMWLYLKTTFGGKVELADGKVRWSAR